MALDLAILDGIRNNQLVSLDLRNKILSLQEIELLVEALLHCSSLQTIDLRNKNIGAEEVKAIMGVLPQCPNLQTINFWSSNRMGVEGVTALAKVLPQCPNLQHINFADNMMGVAGVIALAKVLPLCPNLQHINLGNNNISVEGAKELARVLPQCTNLQHIILNYNNIGVEGAKELARALLHCPNLQQIHLTNNNIGDEGAKELARALLHCPNLQQINLTNNNIGDEGAKELVKALLQCPNLHHINVVDNNIDLKGEMEILSYLKENQYITCCLTNIPLRYNKTDPHYVNQNIINNMCHANRERIKATYQVTELDETLQTIDFYEKLYSCRTLTKAIEDKVISPQRVHTLMKGKNLKEIELQDIRDQSIAELLKEHYINPDLSLKREELLVQLVDKKFYGYDAIPTIIECGHFDFAADLLIDLGITNGTKYFSSLIDAAPDPDLSILSTYKDLASVVLSKIPDLHTNLFYIQEAIYKRKLPLLEVLVKHDAFREGVILPQESFKDDTHILNYVLALKATTATKTTVSPTEEDAQGPSIETGANHPDCAKLAGEPALIPIIGQSHN